MCSIMVINMETGIGELSSNSGVAVCRIHFHTNNFKKVMNPSFHPPAMDLNSRVN